MSCGNWLIGLPIQVKLYVYLYFPVSRMKSNARSARSLSMPCLSILRFFSSSKSLGNSILCLLTFLYNGHSNPFHEFLRGIDFVDFAHLDDEKLRVYWNPLGDTVDSIQIARMKTCKTNRYLQRGYSATVHQGSNQFFAGLERFPQVYSRVIAHLFAKSGHYLGRRISAAPSDTLKRGVQYCGAFCQGSEIVGAGHHEVVVAVKADLNLEIVAHEPDILTYLTRQHPSSGIHEENSICTPCNRISDTSQKISRRDHIRFHCIVRHLETKILSINDIVFGVFVLGNVGSNAYKSHSALTRHIQMGLGTNSRDKECSIFSLFQGTSRRQQICFVSLRRKSVLGAGRTETHTVADLNHS